MEENQKDRLELVIATNFQKAITSIDTTTKYLEKMNTALNSVINTLNSMDKSKPLKNTKQSINEAKNSTDKFYSGLLKVQKALSTGFNLGKLYLLWNVTKRIRDAFVGMIEKSVDFIETTNKFEVAMGDMTDKAYSFQNRLSNAFGTVTKDMMNFQATFKNIMSAIPRTNK